MCKIDGLRSITGSLVILLGTHDLVDTHAVTDKIKHILNSGWEVQEMATSATKRSWKNRFIYM